jgi:hypothetical protein
MDGHLVRAGIPRRREHVEIYDSFEQYKWFVIGALVAVVAIVIARRVRRGRAGQTA